MPRLHRTILYAALLLLPGLLSAVGAASGALGVTPTDLDYGAVVRDEPIQRTIIVQNAKDVPAQVTFQPNRTLAQWVRPEPSAFILPPKSQREVAAILTVPTHAANGLYNGTLIIEMRPQQSIGPGESGVTVGFAVPVHMQANLSGEQILRIQAGGLYVPESEAGKLVTLHTTIENTGNVQAAPQVRVRIEQLDGTRVHDETLNVPPVLPGQARNVTLHANATLPQGQYRLVADVLLAGAVVSTERVRLELHEPGALARRGTMGAIQTIDLATGQPSHRLEAGQGFQVRVPFQNTGQVAVDARLEGYIVRGGIVVRELVSDPVRVEPGEETTIRMLMTDVTEPGQYRIIGAVRYDGKLTQENEAILTLEGGARKDTPMPAGLAVGAGVVAAAALALCQRRRGA